MKYYAQISAIFFVLTVGTTIWMSYELGLLSYGKAIAAEGKAKTTLQPNVQVKSGAAEAKETSLSERERLLSEKEKMINEQSAYYEKVLGELRQKLGEQSKGNEALASQKDAECKVKIKQAEDEAKKKQSSDAEAELKKIKAQLDETKQKLAKTESDWANKFSVSDKKRADLQKEIDDTRDARVDAYQNMYDKMDAKKAAKIMDGMEVDLANKILARVKKEQAAEIMAHMSPEKARVLTEKGLPKRDLASVKPTN